MSLLKIELSIIAVSVVLILISTADFHSAVVTEQLERAAAERKADLKPQDRLALTHPLRCQQTISKRGAGEKWRTHHICADFTEALNGTN